MYIHMCVEAPTVCWSGVVVDFTSPPPLVVMMAGTRRSTECVASAALRRYMYWLVLRHGVPAKQQRRASAACHGPRAVYSDEKQVDGRLCCRV